MNTRDEGPDSNGGHLLIRELDEEGNLITTLDEEDYYPTANDLKTSFEKVIMIDAEENSGKNVGVYVKVVDNAGKEATGALTDLIVDTNVPEIKITADKAYAYHNEIPLYDDDVDIAIKVTDLISGLQDVGYEVVCDGKITQSDSFEVTEGSEEFSGEIVIDAKLNESCNVVLRVIAVDCSGGRIVVEKPFDIDITAPQITFEFDNNTGYVKADYEYYFTECGRIATFTIKDRHFDEHMADDCIKVLAYNANADLDGSKLVGNWTASEERYGVYTAEIEFVEAENQEGVYTASVDCTANAYYDFSVEYRYICDTVYNRPETLQIPDGTIAAYTFVVDTLPPEAEIVACSGDRELGKWTEVVDNLTLNLCTRDSVIVSITASDETTLTKPVVYFKSNEMMSVEDLNNLPEYDWSEYDVATGIVVSENEKFVIYARITDLAGNVKYVSTDYITVDDTKPEVESVKPNVKITPEPSNGIYNSDVAIAVSVVDPDVSSGLKEVRYEVYNMDKDELTQEGTYSFENYETSWSLENAIVVDKNKNNSNNVVIKVYAVDNVGNKAEAECRIQIDASPAEISVRYDNNDGATGVTGGTYFNAGRTATIVVKERNFDPESFRYVVTNSDGAVPALSEWTTNGNGDDTTHTATIRFEADGEYTFRIDSCVDKAMNQNAAPVSNALAPWSFIIDKTAPIVRVAYDNNNAHNGNYYNAQRVATITVIEHHFDPSSIKMELSATDDGMQAPLPELSGWTARGDVYTATITYAADAFYTFGFSYTDMAGNMAATETQSFCVDKTKPVLKIEKIVDESANNDAGNIGFVMTAMDKNLDIFAPVLTATVRKGNSFETKALEIGQISDIKNGKVFTVTNIDTDGIYRITCDLTDKAGNTYSEVILATADGSDYAAARTDKDILVTFSVNRNGSTFEVDENTDELLNCYYIQHVENDIVIVEINADPLKESAVALNGQYLTKDVDYTVTGEGGNGAWMKYTYTVRKSLFAEEGEYRLIVSSEDKAGNDAFSDIKEATVEFVVDRSAPIVTVSGIESDGRYQTQAQRVTLIPTDDGGKLKMLVVNLVNEDGKVIKELVSLEGEALMEALETSGGIVDFELTEGMYQNVQIICSDCSTAANVFEAKITNVSVTTSSFMMFWANETLRWGTIGGLSAAIFIIVMIILKKKQRKV